MIYELKSVFTIPKLVELSKEFLPDVPHENLQSMMIERFGRDSKTFVYEENGIPEGYVFATVEEFNGKNQVFIQQCVVKSKEKHKEVSRELLSRVTKWAEAFGYDWVYFITHRNPRPFMRKFGFLYHGSVLKKKVKGVKSERPIQEQEIKASAVSI